MVLFWILDFRSLLSKTACFHRRGPQARGAEGAKREEEELDHEWDELDESRLLNVILADSYLRASG
jgi:hypothetical protein